MKVLFLDVDGVLNSTRSVLARTGPIQSLEASSALKHLRGLYSEDVSIPYGPQYTLETIDVTAVGLVNRLLKKSGAKLVISSSHRDYLRDSVNTGSVTFKSPFHLRLLGLYFRAMGIEQEIFDITPKLYSDRGNEVQHWLDEHPEVERYVILDDAADFNSGQNLVQCDPVIGFSAENYYKACLHLLVQESTLIY